MKVIITEEQNKKIQETITNYLDSSLTPIDGWDKEFYTQQYEEEGEVFFQLTDETDYSMWYSSCDNQYLTEPLPKGVCPLVVIPTGIYESLEGYFGNLWKPIFKQWFQHHTGLPVKEIDFDN
jgi:hypothetical protein